jgi:membrane-associated phospholipid phosphatase
MKYLTRIGICIILLTGGVQAEGVQQDLDNLFTYRNFGVATAGLGLAALAHTREDAVASDLKKSFIGDGPSSVTNIYGASSFNLPVSFGMWGLGKVAGHAKLAETGSVLLRTLALTQVVVAPIKFAVGRQRPDGSNSLSFPSGHTANSFAVARLLHRRYGQRVGIPLYVLGGFVAVGRIESDRHYLSDVVMGAVLGTLVGNAVTLESWERVRVFPQITSEGIVLALRVDL